MKRTLAFFIVPLFLFAGSSTLFAQRGVGEQVGVAQQPPPPVVTLDGKILAIETHPCEKTTGSSDLGTHLMLESMDAELNIHLGRADAVQHVADLLTIGDFVTIRAFRTEKMLEDHYAAVSITFENQTFQLRDEYLRPVWAGSRSIRVNAFDTRPRQLQFPYGWRRSQSLGFGRGRQWRGGRGRW